METLIKIWALLSCTMADIIYIEQQILKEAEMSFFSKRVIDTVIFLN